MNKGAPPDGYMIIREGIILPGDLYLAFARGRWERACDLPTSDRAAAVVGEEISGHLIAREMTTRKKWTKHTWESDDEPKTKEDLIW